MKVAMTIDMIIRTELTKTFTSETPGGANCSLFLRQVLLRLLGKLTALVDSFKKELRGNQDCIPWSR